MRLVSSLSRSELGGLTDTPVGPALKAWVNAQPEDGKANAALTALIADRLSVPKSAVAVTGGHKSRTKLISIAGDVAILSYKLETALRQV